MNRIINSSNSSEHTEASERVKITIASPNELDRRWKKVERDTNQ